MLLQFSENFENSVLLKNTIFVKSEKCRKFAKKFVKSKIVNKIRFSVKLESKKNQKNREIKKMSNKL